MPDPDPPPTTPTVLVSTAEAAARLGLTPAGVRSRVRRGALGARHGDAGHLLVELPAEAPPAHDGPGPEAALPEDAGRPWPHASVGRRPGAPGTRGGSFPTPPLVPLAGGIIAGLALAYLGGLLRRAWREPGFGPRRR